MKRWALLLVLLGCSDIVEAPSVPFRYTQSLESHSYIVVLRSGQAPSNAHRVYSRVFNGYAVELSSEEAQALRNNPNVKSITPDGVMTTSLSWGLDRIDQRLGLDGSYSSTRTGSGVHAYIIDTGILFSHPEFQGRASLGFDVNGSSGVDCNGHGTHVSGTVGGINYGVAKQVSLVAVKIFPGCESSTPTSSVLSGMEWVLQNAILPAVVNMSVGGDSDPLINEAVQSLTERGITVVVAAGNTALDACLGSPSSAPSAITVGATDQTDTRAPFSSWGSCVDIFAPGVGITSAWKDGGSLTISGTSMATPHVSGVVALYLGEHPQGLPSEVSDSINAYSTKGIVKNASSAAWNLLYSGTTVGGGESTAPLPSLPSAPTNLSISVTKMVNGDVTEYLETFRWSVPSGEIALYVIEGTSGDKSDSFTVPGDRDHGFRQLPEGTWTFHMKAYNMAGYSAWSNSASVCVPGPNTLCDPVIPPDTVTPPDTTTPPVPCRKRGRSGKCK